MLRMHRFYRNVLSRLQRSAILSPVAVRNHFHRSEMPRQLQPEEDSRFTLFGQERLNSLLSSIGADSTLPRDSASISSEMMSQKKQKSIVSFEKTSSGLKIMWEDQPTSFFHSGWLFRTCGCVLCKQPHSGQMLRSPETLPTNPPIRKIWLENDGADICVEWQEDDAGSPHISRVSSLFLLKNRYDDSEVIKRRLGATPKTLTRNSAIPRISFDSVMSSESGLCEWLNCLADYGVAIVSAAPLKPKTVTSLAGRVGVVMHTIYGETWQVRAEETPINIAYSTVGLGLHQDLVYYESPPALQFLHCLRFDPQVSGGESTLMDYFAAAEFLRQTDQKSFKVLCELPATFQKIHYERENPVHLVNRRPHIWICPKSGDIIGGLWAPPFEGPPLLPSSEMQKYIEAYSVFSSIIEDPESNLRITLKLNPGEILTFSNRRMLHGRNAFLQMPNSLRHLEGCYVSAEEFINSLQRTNLKVFGKCNNSALMLGSYIP